MFFRFFFLSFAAMLTYFPGDAQVYRKLRPSAYQKLVKPGVDMVKIQTIEDGSVKKTDSATANNIQVPSGSKTVISYQKKIAGIDNESFRNLNSISSSAFTQEDVKIVPELHVETTGTQNENFVYRIVFSLQQPLRYNESSKKFMARLGFFLLGEPVTNNSSIKEPVNIEVVSNEASINPHRLQITHLNLPSTNVEIEADKVTDSARIKVITVSNPEGYTTYLPVKPMLEIFTTRSILQGFGIQNIPVSVRFIGSNSPDSVKINFTVAKGVVKPASFYLNYNKPSTIYLRSEGIGNAMLMATSNNLQSNALTFTYVFPWMFLLASLPGGLLGGLTKYYLFIQAKKFSAKPVVGGIVIGLICAIAYYVLGINLIGVNMIAEFNEFAVLGISALGTWFGIRDKKQPEKPEE